MEFLSPETQRQLAFREIWSRIRPKSALGKSIHRTAEPFLPAQATKLVQEWDRLRQIADGLQRQAGAAEKLGHLLGDLPNVSGSISRSREGLILTDTEFYAIKKLLLIAKEVRVELDKLGWNDVPPIPINPCFSCLKALSLGQAQKESFYLADGYDRELAQIRQRRRALEECLMAERVSLEKKIRDTTYRLLSTEGEIRVSTSEREKIAMLDKIDGLRRVEETADFVLFRLDVTGPVAQMEQELLRIRELEERAKERVRRSLTTVIAKSARRLLELLDLLANLDFILAKAKFCASFQGTRPILSSDQVILVSQGRHLLLEEEVTSRGLDYTPLDLELKAGVTIITGPNMGGKTACLETVGILIAMAQYGLLVPAAALEFSPRTFIAARLSAAGNPAGLSNFAGEIAFICDAILASGENGLLLLDEIAHGTNPEEGAAIARAVIEMLNRKPLISLITTHYPALARLRQINQLRIRGLDHDRLIKAWQIASEANLEMFQQAMDYRLERADFLQPLKSDAAVVAEALGLDKEIILRAQQLQKREVRIRGDGTHD